MHKTYSTQIKAAGPEDGLNEGQFRAVVSVFNNVDSVGDMVMPGAFSKTLDEWKASGDSIPIYWSHQMQDPDYNIGYVEEAAETEQGLEILGQLDLEAQTSKAPQVYRLLKGRRVTQFSFAYDVIDGSPVDHDGEKVNELRELKLYEVGPTPIGANPATELLAVKRATDRLLTAKAVGSMQDVVDAMTECLDYLGSLGGDAPADEEPAAEATGMTTITVSGSSMVPTFSATTNTSASALSGVKVGRVISAKNEADLRQAADLVLGVLAQIGDKGKASEGDPATDKEPARATDKEPSRKSPVSRLAAELYLLENGGRS